jgi:Tfp pilus assembly protein PilX
MQQHDVQREPYQRLTREERGWAVVTAMMVMTAMLLLGLATVALVDGETNSSLKSRQSEARLNLTEGALATELFQLSHNWPTNSSTPYPDCTDTSTTAPCFTSAQLKANFSGVDVTNLSSTWKVQIRDDVGAPVQTGTCDPSTSNMGGYYDDATVLAASNPAKDANNNCQLWVRAEGTLDGKKRVVVAKVRVDTRPVQFPIAPFVSGSFATDNNGSKKVIVDGQGHAGQVRCTDVTSPSCVDFSGSQVSNPSSVTAGDPSLSDTVLDDTTLDALRKTAKQNGTYYSSTTAGKTTCPADPTGAVVFVEDLSCQYSAIDVNTTTKQGIFLIANGTLKITGNGDWYGAIYLANLQKSSDVVFDMKGTATVHGGVFVDGSGAINMGSSGNAGQGEPNLIYDPTVFPPLQAYGTAGIIQNTWRELTAG